MNFSARMTGTTTWTVIWNTNVARKMLSCAPNVVGSFHTNKTVCIISRGSTRLCVRQWSSMSAMDWLCSLAVGSLAEECHQLRDKCHHIHQKKAPWLPHHQIVNISNIFSVMCQTTNDRKESSFSWFQLKFQNSYSYKIVRWKRLLRRNCFF